MNTVGEKIKLTFFGESHGQSIGFTLDQISPGIKIDESLIKANLSKRRPDQTFNTSRVEIDNFQWISGIKNGITTGAPLTCIVKNTNTISKDYPNINRIPRPSHADLPANIKYKGFNDYRGGGMFSGRLTVLWVIAGSIAQQILENKNIYTGSHILSIHQLRDYPINSKLISKEKIQSLNRIEWPLLNPKLEDNMKSLIKTTQENGDSLGGIIESVVINLPIGLGSPYFHSMESYLSYLLFSIPSVKGIAFGSGFDITEMYGSEANDEYYYENGHIKTKTNHNGGILGGLTNGQPVIIKTAIKPIPTIRKTQNTINLKTHKNTQINMKGRHDPQILTRVYPVINAVINFGILDFMSLDHQL